MNQFELQMEGFCATLIISGHGSKKGMTYTHKQVDFPWTVYCQMHLGKDGHFTSEELIYP